LYPALHPPGTALVRTLEGHPSFVNGVAVTEDGRLVVAGDFAGRVYFLRLAE
jgi:WD40 repeat protein